MFKDIFLVLGIPTLILIIYLFFNEVLTNEILKISNNNQKLKKLKLWVQFFRLNIVSLLFILISSLITFSYLIIFSKITAINTSSSFLRIILASILSGIIYKIYLGSKFQNWLDSFEINIVNKSNVLIETKISKLFIRLRKKMNFNFLKKEWVFSELNNEYQTMAYRINELNKNEIKVLLNLFDSLVLIMTALGLLFTANKVEGTPFDIYMIIFIAIIIAKIHANHLEEFKNEDLQEDPQKEQAKGSISV